MIYRTQQSNRRLQDTQAIWHNGDDRRQPQQDNPRPSEETWRRPKPDKRGTTRNANPYPDFGGDDDDETEKKPEITPTQPTPKQPPQPTATRRTVTGLLRPDQDPDLALGPVHPAVRVVVDSPPWDRGGVMSRQFHLSPYTASEAHAAII